MTTYVASPTSPSEGHLQGLTSEQARERRATYGDNALPTAKPTPAWVIFFAQFKNPLVYIITAAAAISLAVGEFTDFAIIAAVVLLDAVLGFIQEYRAQQTYTALKGLLRPTTTVIRDGERTEIEMRELVPGDLVVLSAGEHVPGDGEMLDATKLAIDEAILTGESEPVMKASSIGNAVAAADSHVYMGTTVRTGRGLMRVTHTGAETELGHIATSLSDEIEDETPLQVRLKAFSHTLTRLVLAITAVIFIVGVVVGRPMLDMLRVAIILAIAAVPEGLLIAVTIILVLGMRKILKRNGLVKRLLAVETLGSVTTICTDKTGTLTEGQMRVTRLDVSDRERAMDVIVRCNDLEGPVDVALWEYAREVLGRDPQDLVVEGRRLGEELFSSATKYMTTLISIEAGTTRAPSGAVAYLKGAPEIVLGMCTAADDERDGILKQVEAWASEGLRLLGLAYRPGAEHAG